MKTACTIAAMLAALGCTEAFILPPIRTVVRQETARSAERINEKVELEKPKVRACFEVFVMVKKTGVAFTSPPTPQIVCLTLIKASTVVLYTDKDVTF